MIDVVIVFIIFGLVLWLSSLVINLVRGNVVARFSVFEEKLPYRVKPSFMSSHERLLYENLRTLAGTKYDVYPQVKLDKIFSVEYQRSFGTFMGFLRKINQKSIDFLVLTRDTQSPILGIELDDSSHEKESRRERDKFVQKIFDKNNLPLVRFNPGQYRVEELAVVLGKYLQ